MIPDRSAIMNAVPGTQVAKSLASLSGKRNGGNTSAWAWMRFGFFLLFQLTCITTNEIALIRKSVGRQRERFFYRVTSKSHTYHSTAIDPLEYLGQSRVLIATGRLQRVVGGTREKRLAGIGDGCSLRSSCLRWWWSRYSSTVVADRHLRSAACRNGRCSLWGQRIRIRADCFWWRAAVQLEMGRRLWVISSSRAHTQRLGHLRAAHHKRHLQRRYHCYRLAIAAAACKRQLCDNDCAYASANHYLGESSERSCWTVLWASGVRKLPPF
jgi:hypothetical protein